MVQYITIVLLCSHHLSTHRLQDDKHDKINSIFNSWHANAMKLHSGIVRIEGVENKNGNKSMIHIILSFDFLKKKELVNFAWPNVPSGAWLKDKNDLTFLESHGKIISKVKRQDVNLAFIKPYDCRFLPLVPLSHLKDGIDPVVQWGNIERQLMNKSTTVSKDNDRTVCKYIQFNSNYSEYHRMDVEFSNADIPLILGVNYYYRSSSNIDWINISTSQISYEKINQVSVPVKLTIEDKTSESVVTLNFNWTNVNEPIDDEVFDIKNFPLLAKALLVDSRISKSKPVIMGMIEPSTENRTELSATQSGFSPNTKLLIASVLTALVATFVYIAMRIATRRKTNPTFLL